MAIHRDKSPGQLSTSEVCQDIRQLHSHSESFTAICEYCFQGTILSVSMLSYLVAIKI